MSAEQANQIIEHLWYIRTALGLIAGFTFVIGAMLFCMLEPTKKGKP